MTHTDTNCKNIYSTSGNDLPKGQDVLMSLLSLTHGGSLQRSRRRLRLCLNGRLSANAERRLGWLARQQFGKKVETKGFP